MSFVTFASIAFLTLHLHSLCVFNSIFFCHISFRMCWLSCIAFEFENYYKPADNIYSMFNESLKRPSAQFSLKDPFETEFVEVFFVVVLGVLSLQACCECQRFANIIYAMNRLLDVGVCVCVCVSLCSPIVCNTILKSHSILVHCDRNTLNVWRVNFLYGRTIFKMFSIFGKSVCGAPNSYWCLI